MCAEVPHKIPEGKSPKPIELLLSRGCKAPSQLVGQYKRFPVAYTGTPADIRITTKPFVYLFTFLQWLVDNWEKWYFRYDFVIKNNGLAMIDITLK